MLKVVEVKIVSNDKEMNDAFTVRKNVFIEEQNVPEEEEMDQFDQTATHFVVYDQGNPVGAGRFRVIDGIGKVERICIVASVRKKGLGKLIMDEIERFAATKGIQTVKLNAQIHAEPFYQKIGYETVSDEFMDAGIPHVAMTKILNN